MSLAAAVPLGVGSAVVYGMSIVVQHRTAQEHADDEPSAAGLLRQMRSPAWLLAIGGDFVGFLLQIAALSAGSVVIVQPLVVLMLPVALLVSYLLGGPRPGLGELLGVTGVLAGLGVFMGLVGHGGMTHVPKARYFALTVAIVFVAGILLCLAVTGRNRIVRAVTFGAVAGVYFGTLAVLVDAASERVSRTDGLGVLFTTPRGLVPLVGIVVVGVGGIVLTQLSFQIGALGATLPANLATDPLTGVVLGAALLREHLPTSPWHIAVYVLCLAAVLAGTIRLANPYRDAR
ncbi:DMT family transporter [uncultured Jatrophihabitans sp.]|uniref:DMT family transporter n=1 Tax=uncultured Jatrophihabitans sp. TaxID=1610747 RepID=UPI0035CC6451